MACIYRRKGSRFYWLKYRDPGTGEMVRISTGLDIALPDSKRKALKQKAEKTVKEKSIGRTNDHERWEAWAREYFEARYANKNSRKNAIRALVELTAYFQACCIRTPRQVTYDIAAGFVPWRVEKMEDENQSLEIIGRNTAKLRFVYFKILMSEAVRRGFCESNPCREVEVYGEDAKEKNEITADDEVKIEAALAARAQWMRDQWEVLMCHGCRIAETNVPLERITDKTITFKIKGGRMHVAPLHPAIKPIIQRAKEEGRTTLFAAPSANGAWSSVWSAFFKKLGLPYSAHCTRVTVITRLIRAGHSIAEVCNFIGHTEEVNRIYRKLKPADSAGLLLTLARAANPSSGSQTP